MPTILGPFEGDNVHEALADAMLKTSVVDVAATVRKLASSIEAFAIAATVNDSGSMRAVLLRHPVGWILAMGDGELDDQQLIDVGYSAADHALENGDVEATESEAF